jgi:hypothetical protein
MLAKKRFFEAAIYGINQALLPRKQGGQRCEKFSFVRAEKE